ncbi:MAG: OmpA/MotB domain protein [Bryobacterales bacterium]|nr:OmpA/MotB domain protein [Bryobacterales bacterium]
MTNQLFTSIILGGALLTSGCATKKYVAKTTDPIRDHVNQVASQADQQGQKLDQQGQQIGQQGDELKKHGADIDQSKTDISANKERAMAADSRAGEAIQKSDQNTRALSELRQTVANLDDYKPSGTVAVPFAFNKDVLTAPAKEELDRLVADKTSLKRYFIAVEGFTDKTGTVQYNNALSKRRADAVVMYLVAKHDIPVYRIHEIGLGEEKPADEGKGRAANAKNRRVEVTFFSADPQVTARAQ